MSALSPVLCVFGRHRPHRRDIEWNGTTYVTKCRHCHKEIERISHNHWKRHQA